MEGYKMKNQEVLRENLEHNDRYLRNKFVYNRWVEPLKITSILDVGCSDNYMKILHKNTIGIDIASGADIIINLESKYLPFRNQSFNCIICLDVLEHLDNLHSILDQFIGITKRYIILSFPNELRWLYLIRYFYKTNDREFGLFPKNRHKWFLSYSQTKDFISKYSSNNKLKIVDEFVKLGPTSEILHKFLKSRFPNLMPYSYFVVLKKTD